MTARALLVIVFFAFAANNSMFTLQGILTILNPAAQLGILAMAASLLMISGEFDLSIGSMIAFAGLIFGLAIIKLGLPLSLAIVATMAVAAAFVHQPSSGEFLLEGRPVAFTSPREALDAGIATVYQDLAMIPLMSITRNFFMEREPRRGMAPFRYIDLGHCDDVTREEMRKIGIDVRDPQQAVGTLSGGERQCVAIARAVYFGAKVLILDEPTSALGGAQTSMVLKYVNLVRSKGLGVIFITHNVRHAYAVGQRFTVLKRGRTLGTYTKSEIAIEDLQTLMAGGKELQELSGELGGMV